MNHRPRSRSRPRASSRHLLGLPAAALAFQSHHQSSQSPRQQLRTQTHRARAKSLERHRSRSRTRSRVAANMLLLPTRPHDDDASSPPIATAAATSATSSQIRARSAVGRVTNAATEVASVAPADRLSQLPKLGGLFASYDARDRRTRSPFLCGDNFRSLAHHVIDHEAAAMCLTWENVRAGDIVYATQPSLRAFFQVESRIDVPYVLVSHNYDEPLEDVVTQGAVEAALARGCLRCWFGLYLPEAWVQAHPQQLIPLPLGIAGRGWTQTASFETHVERLRMSRQRSRNPSRTDSKTDVAEWNKHPWWHVFCCWNEANCPDVRHAALLALQTQKLAAVYTYGCFDEYVEQMARHTYVASPAGHGADCYRTWEALYVHAFPVVVSSYLDSLYDGLPVLIVPSWSSVTRDLLAAELHRLQHVRAQLDLVPMIQRRDHSLYWEHLILRTAAKLK